MQGLISRGLLVSSSRISEAEGLLVGVGLQQLRSSEPLQYRCVDTNYPD